MKKRSAIDESCTPAYGDGRPSLDLLNAPVGNLHGVFTRDGATKGGMNVTRRQLGISLGGMVALVVCMALVPMRDHTSNVNIALALVLVVLGAAAIGGSVAGLSTALVVAAAFDFFFTQPYLSLKIADARDVQTTLLLLAVGLAVGQIAAMGERFRSGRRADVSELRRLHHVSALLRDGDSSSELIESVGADLVDVLELAHCRFERPAFGMTLPELAPSGALVGPVAWRGAKGLVLPRAGVAIPVVAGGRLLGRYVLVPVPGLVISLERRLLATALVGQLQLALAPAA
jgi:hypothetical protein